MSKTRLDLEKELIELYDGFTEDWKRKIFIEAVQRLSTDATSRLHVSALTEVQP